MVYAATPLWLPSDNGLIGATDDMPVINNSAVLIGGTRYFRKYFPRQGQTITNIWTQLQAAGSGTSTGSFFAVYSSSGALLGVTADIASLLTGTLGPISAALVTPVTIPGTGFVWIACLSNLSVSQPTLRAADANVNVINTNLVAATLAGAVNGTSVTTMPTSVTPANMTASGAFPIWFGVN